MNPTTFTISIIVLVVLVMGVAFLLYKSDFRLTKLKATLGFVEAEMERQASDDEDESNTTEKGKETPQFVQEATDGGQIEKAEINTTDASGASATQRARGKDSKLTNVKINIKHDENK